MEFLSYFIWSPGPIAVIECRYVGTAEQTAS